jgi:prolyl 3-hydroxylase /prolyl 3,4-dihydroxylase
MTPLSNPHIAYLSKFLNPIYLEPVTMSKLASRFVELSNLELHSYLCTSLAEKLAMGLRELDVGDGLGPDREGRIPPHTSGTQGSWRIKGPPHKWRYCTLSPSSSPAAATASPPAPPAPPPPKNILSSSSDEIIRKLQDELFPSEAFRAWIAIVSRLLPLRYTVEARRFRPGLDYTLAKSEENEARLDVCLELTPEVGSGKVSNGKEKEKERDPAELTAWQSGEWGGWEVCVFEFCMKHLFFFLTSRGVSVTWLLMMRKMIRLYTDREDLTTKKKQVACWRRTGMGMLMIA